MRQIKSTFAYVVEFKIGFEFLLVEVVFLSTQFFCIVPPIPRLQFFARQIFVHHFLQFGSFAFSSFERGCPYRLQELVYCLVIFGHTIRQDIVRRIVIAEHLGPLDTQFHFANDNRLVIIGVVMVATSGIGHQQLFAQVTVLAILEYRSERSAFRSEQPLAFMSGSLSLFSRSSFSAFRQSFEFGFVFDKILVRIGLSYDIVAKLEAEQAELFVDLSESRFFVCGQVGTVVDK